MKLTDKEIKHIAELARLKLSNKEKSLYKEQLSGILDYFEQLKEVNTDEVDPSAQVTGLKNVFRDDVIEEWEVSEKNQALKQAPELDGNQVRVKRVIQ